jgi:hypothetical protein
MLVVDGGGVMLADRQVSSALAEKLLVFAGACCGAVGYGYLLRRSFLCGCRLHGSATEQDYCR